MKDSIFSLRRLRWKLTLSYTLVAVVTLLAVELLAVSALVVFLNSPLFPTLITQQVRDEFVPGLEKPLSQDPPNVERLREELTLSADRSGVRGADAPSPDEPGFDFRLTPDEGALFVIDEEGRLLVAAPELRGFAEGEPFEADRVPGLDPLVDAALNGEEKARNLSRNTPQGRILTAIPVEDDNGRVIGALVGTFRMPNLTAPLLISVGVSAVLLMVPAAFLGTIFGFFTAWGLTRRLRRLALAARSWSRGDFSVVTRDRSKDELGQLSRELNDMAAQLESLIQARGELATLEARNRFARDLHDSVKQQVFATSLQIAAARALIERDTGSAESHLSQADELVRQAQKELNVLIQEMRPAALEGEGLATALGEYAADWSRRSEISAEVHVRGEREAP